ncbi:MAG: crossover junction endodeoxyribonuclease RuvC [Candidatus Falkowbacteria bacterium]|nr:crossover junction endodeoxyribonuclease RuvC [Candidatus Falkowbacteria bacterium]
MSKRIIIGFDPGIADTGYGVIEDQGNKMICLEYGSIKTPAKQALSQRLVYIYKEVSALLKKYKPDLVSIEHLFFCRNVSSAMAVGAARGVLLLAVEQAKVELVEYTPNQVKQAISSYGAASKQQVQKMVKLFLNLKEIPKPDDAADALAMAICASSKK